MTEIGRATAGPTGALDDAEIVRRVRAGETALFEVLMRRHNTRVYRSIRSILRDEAETEDAMQQAYLRAYSHLGEFEGASAFSTWLVRIAINEALGRLRRVRLVPMDAEPEEAARAAAPRTPEDDAAAREAMALLEKAIDRLPLHYRTVYVLREVDELSTADTATALDLTEEAVKVRLHRARLALRDIIAAEVGDSARAAFPFLAPRCDRVVAAVMTEIARQRPPAA